MSGQTPVADLIRNRREQLGLSLRELEARSGISYATISNIENRHVKTPSEVTLRGLAIGLDLPLSTLSASVGAPMMEMPEFRLPKKARNLTEKQRRAVLAMIEALLDQNRPD